MSCQVLRCAKPTSHIERVSPDGGLPVQVGFCAGHWTEVEGGAPYHVEYQHPDASAGLAMAGQLVILMGDDMPLTFVTLNLRDHVGSQDKIEASLELLRGDGSTDIVDFLIPRSELNDLSGVLRLFGGGGD